MRYYPNRSSSSGYGSDQWMFLCRIGDDYYILCLDFSGEYGKAIWSCLPIEEKEAARIQQTEACDLRSVFYENWNQEKVIIHLHPETLCVIREIVIPDYHRTGKLTDDDLLET